MKDEDLIGRVVLSFIMGAVVWGWVIYALVQHNWLLLCAVASVTVAMAFRTALKQ